MSENDDDDEKEAEIKAVVFVICSLLLGVVLLLSKALHVRPKLNTYLSEPAMILIVGMTFSYFISLIHNKYLMPSPENENYNNNDDDFEEEAEEVTRDILSFSPNFFYMALLPPILYNSGYELERDMFMRHIKPIVIYAAAGTALSAFGTGFLLYLFRCFGWFGGGDAGDGGDGGEDAKNGDEDGGNFNPTLLELLTFGALIAATDTVSVLGVLKAKRVDPHLFSLVFGESALNDGVAIVLFRTLATMLDEDYDSNGWTSAKVFFRDFFLAAIGSPMLGIIFSYLAALVFKFADLTQQRTIELSFYMLLMYVPFVLAEILHLSGIVGIFFAGMSARRYIEPNLSVETQANARTIFKLVAYLAETIIFLHVGLSIFGFHASYRWDFIGLALMSALAGRALGVYPTSLLFNHSLTEPVKEPLLDVDNIEDEGDDCSVGSSSTTSSEPNSSMHHQVKRRTPNRRKDKVIPIKFMHILWFAGLRGAVAYACAVNFPNSNGNRDTFLAATIIIVLVTIIVMGGVVEPMILCLGIRVGVDDKEYMNEWRRVRKLKGRFHHLERKYMLKTAVRDYGGSMKSLPSNPYIVEKPPGEIALVSRNVEGFPNDSEVPQQQQTDPATIDNMPRQVECKPHTSVHLIN